MELDPDVQRQKLSAFIEQVRPLFEILPEAVRILDTTGIVRYVNLPFLQMTGYSLSEVIDRSFEESYVDEDRTRVRMVLNTTLKSVRFDMPVEARFKRKGSDPVTVSFKPLMLKDDHGNPIGALAILRDVSRLDRILTEPMELLNMTGSPIEILRQLPGRVASFFPGRPWVMINLIEGDYLRFAYAINVPAELMAKGGMPVDESICAIPAVSKEVLIIADLPDDPRTKQHPVVTQHGCRGYIGCPVVNSSGEVLGVICVLRQNRGGFGEHDSRIIQMFSRRVTMELERFELEAKSDQTEKEMHDLVEHAPFMIWRARPDGMLKMMSKKGRGDLGLDERRAWQKSWLELIHPDDRPEVKALFDRYAATRESGGGGTPVSMPVRILKADGTHGNFFTTLRPVRDSMGALKLMEGVAIEVPGDEEHEEDED